MVLLGKGRTHLISDLVGAGPIGIVFSIIVVGCFGLACACFILLGHAVFLFLQFGNVQKYAGLHCHTNNWWACEVYFLFLEYDVF